MAALRLPPFQGGIQRYEAWGMGVSNIMCMICGGMADIDRLKDHTAKCTDR